MADRSAEVVICGAGIAGIATAYHLTETYGVQEVMLVEREFPLTVTSDKSTECYRNWWPGPGDAMVRMTNRSIDLLDQWARDYGNPFNLNRRGYLFATSDPARVHDFREQGEEAEELGAGPLRIHDGTASAPEYIPAPDVGFEGLPIGSDLITDPGLIREHFPYLTEETVGVIHARRCGWFSAQQLGMFLLERAQIQGAKLVNGEVIGVKTGERGVEAVEVENGSGRETIRTRHFVNAAGPFVKPVAEMVGVKLPVYSEYHAKVSIRDEAGVYPRDAGLLIWTDPQYLPWSREEREILASDGETQFLLQEFPQGVHARSEGPEDSPIVLILWTYDTEPVKPTFPPKEDPFYPEIVMRGLATMIPEMKRYFDKPPKPFMDGGYYTKTQENRPLVGPLSVPGTWIIGALSGFGLMASPACGELLAAHIAGSPVPEYARWFYLDRYQDPEYQQLLGHWRRSGQL